MSITNLKINIDEKLKSKSELFTKNLYSNMHFRSEIESSSLSFEWVNELEFACPYIDNIIRNPKLTLINESEVVKIERAKKITVESVKDLSKHTHFIDKIDPITQEVKPSKILVLRREETFNTYENRFIYTLIINLSRFVAKMETLLEDIKAKSDKVLEYAASTNNGTERVIIELKVSANKLSKSKQKDDFEKEIEEVRERVRKIRDYISSWRRSEFMTSLDKAHVAFVIPPIKKTNMILKNPNFQIAMKTWEFLQNYIGGDEEDSKEGIDTTGDNILKEILGDSFLMDYFVLDSISSTKREQKKKLSKYAMIMISKQIQRMIELLISSGIDIDDDEILSIFANEIKSEKSKRTVGSSDIKKKFKNVMDEYLEKTQDYL